MLLKSWIDAEFSEAKNNSFLNIWLDAIRTRPWRYLVMPKNIIGTHAAAITGRGYYGFYQKRKPCTHHTCWQQQQQVAILS